MPQKRYRPEEIIAAVRQVGGPPRPGQEGARAHHGDRQQRSELLSLAQGVQGLKVSQAKCFEHL